MELLLIVAGGILMRSFSINLRGRIKNFNLPKNQHLIPLFEAIVNSIHAIEERRNATEGFRAVSYTHLRVEKKEIAINSRGRPKGGYEESGDFLKAVLAKASPEEKERWKQMQHPISPVSYTHLDVYKRQV